MVYSNNSSMYTCQTFRRRYLTYMDAKESITDGEQAEEEQDVVAEEHPEEETPEETPQEDDPVEDEVAEDEPVEDKVAEDEDRELISFFPISPDAWP